MNRPYQDALGHRMGDIAEDAKHVHINHDCGRFRMIASTSRFVGDLWSMNQLPGSLCSLHSRDKLSTP